MSERTAPSATDAPAPKAGEGCPTPLAWQEVLSVFREQRDEYQLSTSWGDVSLWEFGDGRPVCFLADAAGDAELFALTAWLLREEYRCLLVTFPDPPDDVDAVHWLPGTADLLDHTLSSRDYSDVPIFGAGYGGLIALQTAVSHPDQIGRLIVQGCQPGRCWTLRERMLLALGRRSRRPLCDVPLWSRVVESNNRRWFPPFDDSRWQFLREKLGTTSTRRFARCMTAAGQSALETHLTDIQAPTLIVRTEGEGGRATKAQEARWQLRLPNATVEWMHSTGQFPYVTHPHRLVKLIREHLNAGHEPGEEMA